MKKCCRCKEFKSLDCFTKNKTTKDGFMKACRECRNSDYRKYHKEHPEVAKNRLRRWNDAPENKGKARVLRYNNTRRNRELKQENNLTNDDIQFLLKFQENKCAMCKKDFSIIPYTIDHIVPLSKGGGLNIQNAQLLCRSCNSRKGVKVIRLIPLLPFGGY